MVTPRRIPRTSRTRGTDDPLRRQSDRVPAVGLFPGATREAVSASSSTDSGAAWATGREIPLSARFPSGATTRSCDDARLTGEKGDATAPEVRLGNRNRQMTHPTEETL
ncbi:hypothetical protein GCM10009609_48450 [Pseudonocardia aurantiaca]